jgi:hypothetical protein
MIIFESFLTISTASVILEAAGTIEKIGLSLKLNKIRLPQLAKHILPSKKIVLHKVPQSKQG